MTQRALRTLFAEPFFFSQKSAAHSSRTILGEKIGRAQNQKRKESFFVLLCSDEQGGGAASLGVLLKVGSSKVQNFPQIKTASRHARLFLFVEVGGIEPPSESSSE